MELTFTPKAERFIQRMITFGGGSSASAFRLAVKPGGCSGLSYEFRIVESPEPGDVAITSSGIPVFLEQESVPFLNGVVVDCEDSLMHTGLVFTNPNAAASCGCGTSFTPKE
ncbi:iron-sulfur cluster assembly accessory protein [Acidithiobacillus ferrianus]|uniref:Iron-sulfur cluster assembly accessory protein n=2 Tax=Acidithiobacillus ferrianus TaxID=2678518 RepID=A0A845U8B4_9PROT|nr:iron-sulfur cluster assembly accessory protein [Acidithiobacillus ferrianus]NDU42409.1 iron-sulfur cluster assembly accessory protein [Acidithiobacillus ferrianus]